VVGKLAIVLEIALEPGALDGLGQDVLEEDAASVELWLPSRPSAAARLGVHTPLHHCLIDS